MTTLAQLRDGAQQLADFTDDDDFVSAATWLLWLNQAIVELHRLIVSSEPDSYFETEDFTISSGNSYALPSNFHSIRGLTFAPDTPIAETVHKFTFGDRDMVSTGLDPRFVYGRARRREYRVVKPTLLELRPPESAAGDYRLYYIPKPTTLYETRTFAIDSAANPTTGPDPDLTYWSLPGGGFTSADVGRTLTLTFDSPNGSFSGDYTIVSVTASTTAGVAAFSTAGFTNPAGGTATVVSTLDGPLDEFAEYVQVVAAIKAIAKEEGDTRELEARKNVLRDDILRAFRNDDSEPDQIVDVQ